MGGICSCCSCCSCFPCCRPKSKLYPPSEPTPRKPEPPSRNLQPSERTKVPSQSQTFFGSPFSKSGLSKTDRSNLISGYENEPVGSLEEALTPFYGKIDHLSDYVQEAKTKCHFPSEHSLTRDESAAIYIYTKKWGNGSLYDHLQTAWESNDKAKMKPWLKYLKLFKNGYEKLPAAKGEVWKGKSFDPRLEQELNSKSVSLYAAMDIFSTSKASAEQSLHNEGVKKKMLIGLQDVGAKRADGYAADNQSSALVYRGAKVAVSNKMESSDGSSVTYHLKGATPLQQPIKEHSVTPRRNRSLNITPMQESNDGSQLAEQHYLCPNVFHTCFTVAQSLIVMQNDALYWKVNYF